MHSWKGKMSWMYTDFHTHILPQIDDGAENIATAVQMLTALQRQDVDRIVFTPHFYIDHTSINDFIIKRQSAYEQLKEQLDILKDMDLRLAAEVYLVPGISMLEGLEALCIEKTDYLLLELPYKRITPQIIREIDNIYNKRGLHVILAHIERNLKFNTIQEFVEAFAYWGVVYQVNTECFLTPLRCKPILELLSGDTPVVLGTDTHNMTTRPPNYSKAIKVLEKRCDLKYLQRISTLSSAILSFAIAL